MSLELIFRHNDPTQTLLVTSDGIPMYQIATPLSTPSAPTTIKRFTGSSTGRVFTVVGEVAVHESTGMKLEIVRESGPCVEMAVIPSTNEELDRPWSFIGPDGQSYIWRILFSSPVLFLNDNSQTPLARYRRAKIGIVSRSRRAFLEIFPPGIAAIDLIVVTFVSFSKQRMVNVAIVGSGGSVAEKGVPVRHSTV